MPPTSTATPGTALFGRHFPKALPSVLQALANTDTPLSVTALVAITGHTDPTVRTALNRLDSAGWVNHSTDTDVANQTRWQLTAAGRDGLHNVPEDLAVWIGPARDSTPEIEPRRSRAAKSTALDDLAPDPSSTPKPKPHIRTRPDVAAATPHDLAMMSRDEVDALDADSRQLRVERIRTDKTTKWDIREVAAYARREPSTIVKWRNRQLQNTHQHGRWMHMPPALPERRRTRASGQDSAQWLMSDLLIFFAKMNACDRHDYVFFPEGRKPPGAVVGRTPPTQRTRR